MPAPEPAALKNPELVEEECVTLFCVAQERIVRHDFDVGPQLRVVAECIGLRVKLAFLA